MSPAQPTRRAARVLLLNGRDELLLLHGFDPSRPAAASWWITPGGGLEPGEEPLAGAVRELFEETGLALSAAELSGPVYERVIDFEMEDQRYRQAEWFYTARVDAWTVDTRGFTPLEQRSVDGHRWWSVAEMRLTDEQLFPAHLPDLVAGVLALRKEA